LSSRYCPIDARLFLVRFGVFAATLGALALLAAVTARRAKSARRKELAYLGVCAIVLFAIGYGALVIFGLSGCGAGYTPGLTWEWPW